MCDKPVDFNSYEPTINGTEDSALSLFDLYKSEDLKQNNNFFNYSLYDNELNDILYKQNNNYCNNQLSEDCDILNFPHIENENNQSNVLEKNIFLYTGESEYELKKEIKEKKELNEESKPKKENKESIAQESEAEPKKEKKELKQLIDPEPEPEPNNVLNELEPIEEIKLLGRKKKDDIRDREHDKYKEDNMSRKIKVKVKDALLEFINSKIKESDFSFVINNKLYSGEEVMLLNITDKKIINTNVDYNIKLFRTKIKYVLGDEISGRFKKYPKNFNEEIINNIYASENGGHIRNILDKTFLECLRYYRMDEDIFGNDSYACLSGLQEGFQEFKKELSEDNDKKYEDGIINLINKFETVYSSKTPRKRKGKNMNKELYSLSINKKEI